MIRVSIVIPTYNEEKFLPALLESIKRQNYKNYEVIIADANSTDKTRDIAKSYGCKIVEGGTPAVGRNSGAKHANGDLLLFLDADTILTPNYLEKLVKNFMKEDIGIAITQISPVYGNVLEKILHEIANKAVKMLEPVKPHGSGGFGIATWKILHDKIGGFDESLDFGEDTDYIQRMSKITKFKVLKEPRLLISTRRLKKEGLKNLTAKYTKSTIHQFLGKNVSAKELNYNFEYRDVDAPSVKIVDEIFGKRKRILYGVCGEGMGHAIRSGVILEELSKKHSIKILASGKAYKYLSKKFEDVYEIGGFNTVYENNRVNTIKTFFESIRRFPKHLISNFWTIYRIVNEFNPHIVISDFEFYSSLFANIMRLPLISIDNIHVISRCKIKYPRKYWWDRIKAEIVIRLFVIKAKKYLITTYYFPQVKYPENTKLYPPILRKKIIKLKPSYGDHVFVYQTSKTNKKLLNDLKKINQKFIIYGFDENKEVKNLKFKKFNESEFYDDLASAKAVITNGGFSLISEALYLKKPILSIPIQGQFEQILNALYLDKLGYGKFIEESSVGKIMEFLNNLDKYREKLKDYEYCGNDFLISDLEEIIDEYAKPEKY